MFFQVFTILISFSIIFGFTTAYAESVPDWVKNTAGWWANDSISETEFVTAIEFLIKDNIIQVDTSQSLRSSQGVPDGVKNTADRWANDYISETEFCFLEGIPKYPPIFPAPRGGDFMIFWESPQKHLIFRRPAPEKCFEHATCVRSSPKNAPPPLCNS